MPTVLRAAGFRIVIYPADHRPAHVHAIGQGGEAVFDLHCPGGPPELREVFGLSRSDVGRARAAIVRGLADLRSAWESFHGSP
jgi:hypothetical protein